MKILSRFCVLTSLTLSGACFAQSSNFRIVTGDPADVQLVQNSFVFSPTGVNATAKSWSVSRTATDARFEQGDVVQWGPGIGSKGPTETTAITPLIPFYIDNEDHYDFVLFVFDQSVDLSSLELTNSRNGFDMDINYSFGNVAQNIDLTGSSIADLSSLGFGTSFTDDVGAAVNTRNVSLTTPAGGANALLVSARIGGDTIEDRFKIAALNGTVIPEPSTTIAFGIAALAFLGRRKR